MSYYRYECASCGTQSQSQRGPFRNRPEGRGIPDPCYVPTPNISKNNNKLCETCYSRHSRRKKLNGIAKTPPFLRATPTQPSAPSPSELPQSIQCTTCCCSPLIAQLLRI